MLRRVRYRVRRVAVGPVTAQAATAGALVASLPGALCGLLLVSAVRLARAHLEAWQAVRLPLPSLPGLSVPPVSFVDLLRLSGALAGLRWWDAHAALAFALALAGAVATGAVAGAAAGLLAVALYNAGARTGGGLVVELEPLEAADRMARGKG